MYHIRTISNTSLPLGPCSCGPVHCRAPCVRTGGPVPSPLNRLPSDQRPTGLSDADWHVRHQEALEYEERRPRFSIGPEAADEVQREVAEALQQHPVAAEQPAGETPDTPQVSRGVDTDPLTHQRSVGE